MRNGRKNEVRCLPSSVERTSDISNDLGGCGENRIVSPKKKAVDKGHQEALL
jgi:hypothetical protein